MSENNSQSRRRGPMGGPMGGPAMMGEKAKDFKGSFSKLMSYMKSYLPAIIIGLLCAAGSAVFSIIGPKKLGNATTLIYEGIKAKMQGTGGIDFTEIKKILIFIIVLYGVSAILSLIQNWIMSGVSQKVSYKLRKEISEKIDRMPMKYFDKNTHGEVLSRVTNDVDTLGMNLNQSISQTITSFATVVGVLVMMFSISVQMTLIALVIIPISAVLVMLIVGKSQKHFKAQQEYLGHVNGEVEEVFGGHNIVKAFNKEESFTKDFDEKNKKLYESAWKSQFISGMMYPIMMFVGNLGYVAVAIFGGMLVLNGKMKVGDIQSFIQYVKNFTMPINQLAQISSVLQAMAAAAERVFEFLGEDEEDQKAHTHAAVEGDEDDENEPHLVKMDELSGNVEFDHIQFGYSPDKIIIHDFSAKVKAGQKIAIVGPTGAGKTTMVKLLMRFYDVNGGSISLGGYNINDFDRSELRQAFGMVLQDTWLFKGTIMENIRYGKLDATDEEVIAAAKAAHVHHFIQTLPNGYNMELNEEASNVSQGQKQLLTIARAILADKKILILDEATSSVDTRTEIRIQKAMDNLAKGRTSFIIAHRLSTIKEADMILVMRDGDIIEHGSHKELLEQNGFYASLYKSQFEDVNAG